MNSTEAMTTGRENGIKPIGKRSVKHVGAWMLQTLCAGLLMLCSIHAQADTIHIPYSKAYGANFNNLSFNASFSPSRDLPINSVLQSASANGQSSYTVSCATTKTVTVAGTPVPGMADTYQTNVPGIGVHFYITQGWSGSNYISVPSSETLNPATSSSPQAFYTRADLVVTGPIGSGTLTDLPSMTVLFSADCVTQGANAPQVQALNPGAAITARSCSVTTPAVDVTLPKAFAKDLSTAGATTGATAFNLGVNCPQGANVKVTLTDASDASNQSTTLGLAPGSSAAGIGLQIVNGSTPIAYGPDSATAGNTNQWSAGTAPSGPMNIPLTVQYVRTSGTLIPGTAKGTATFTMSYQ
ncbi:fimbrial protein [Paraburkholderia sp. D1E]|uniref:fimbrial protein n=1 Tax=Paraburkholderia sp. D1E TaxID=3461398 RepID=UPI004045C51F